MPSQNRLARFSRGLLLSAGLVVLLALAFALYVRSEKRVDRAHELRHRSFLLADELRQSSDDLTRLVRTYVVTGDPVYKQHYQDILDIRDGKQPRPEGYGRIYWDLVLPGGPTPRPESPQAIALLELMRQAGFADEEFRKLAEAKANSDALTVPEFEAMKLVESTGPEAEANRTRARRMMYDDKYHQAKAAIMKPIDEFYALVDQRTFAAVQTAENHATALRYVFVAFGLALMVMLWRTCVALRDTLGGSVGEVHAQIARIGSGDFSSAIQVKDALKNSGLGWLSETQAKLTDSERERKPTKTVLENLQRQHQHILDSVGEGVHGIDREGKIIFENPAAATLLGWDVREMPGQPAPSLIHHTRADGSPYPVGECHIYATLRDGVARRVEDEVFWRKDGTSFPVAYTRTPMRNDAGEILGAVVAFRDITERKRAEERLRVVVEASPNALMMVDHGGGITLVNAQAENLVWLCAHGTDRPAH